MTSNLRRLIREAVRRVLAESVCPTCGDPEAYVGFSAVECPNPACKNFSPRQAQEVGRESEDQGEREVPDVYEIQRIAGDARKGSWDAQNDLRDALRALKGVPDRGDSFDDPEVEAVVGLAIDAADSMDPDDDDSGDDDLVNRFYESLDGFVKKYDKKA